MNCSKVQKVILDYVYEELPARKVLDVERHIRECPECAKKLEEIQFTRRAFSHIEVKVPSNGTVEKVLSAARETASARGSRGRRVSALRTVEFWRPFLAGAACVLFMMAISQLAFNLFTREVRVPVKSTVAAAGDYETSRIRALPVAHFDPRDRSAVDKRYNTATLLMLTGYRYQAFCLFKDIHRNAPRYEKNYLVSRYIGDIYRDAGLYEKAWEYYTISMQMRDSPEARQRIAEIEHLLRVQQETDG